MGTHSIKGEREENQVISAWVGFLHCASDGGSYDNKWLQLWQTAAGKTGVITAL